MEETAPTRRTENCSDEATVLAGMRAGEEKAFKDCVAAHCGRLLAVARRILSNEEDARDAVQDALLSAFRSLDRFDGHAALGTWPHHIAVNAALTRLRSRRRRPGHGLPPVRK